MSSYDKLNYVYQCIYDQLHCILPLNDITITDRQFVQVVTDILRRNMFDKSLCFSLYNYFYEKFNEVIIDDIVDDIIDFIEDKLGMLTYPDSTFISPDECLIFFHFVLCVKNYFLNEHICEDALNVLYIVGPEIVSLKNLPDFIENKTEEQPVWMLLYDTKFAWNYDTGNIFSHLSIPPQIGYIGENDELDAEICRIQNEYELRNRMFT